MAKHTAPPSGWDIHGQIKRIQRLPTRKIMEIHKRFSHKGLTTTRAIIHDAVENLYPSFLFPHIFHHLSKY